MTAPGHKAQTPPHPPPPPPVLYQHLKIVSGPFFGVKIRSFLGLSDPQKTHERTLAPVLKVIFVFRVWIFRVCGEVLDVFLTLRTTPDPQFWGGRGGARVGGGVVGGGVAWLVAAHLHITSK